MAAAIEDVKVARDRIATGLEVYDLAAWRYRRDLDLRRQRIGYHRPRGVWTEVVHAQREQDLVGTFEICPCFGDREVRRTASRRKANA